MKAVLLIAAASVALSGCASAGLGGGTSQADFLKALQAMASDPRCGHTDRLQGDIGGLGSGLHVFLERTCPPDPTKVPVPQ